MPTKGGFRLVGEQPPLSVCCRSPSIRLSASIAGRTARRLVLLADFLRPLRRLSAMQISVNRGRLEACRAAAHTLVLGALVVFAFGILVYWLRVDESVIQEMNAADFQRDFWTHFIKDSRRARVELAVNDLPHFSREVGSCGRWYENETRNWRYDEARKWAFDGDSFLDYQLGKKKKCSALIEKFAFLEEPLSVEEADYPLAYGMIVYQNAAQVYYSLSSIYQPQNAYCIAVDGKSTPEFKRRMHDLADCLPHVTVIDMEELGWCWNSVLDALYSCFSNLTLSQHPWRYYQENFPLHSSAYVLRLQYFTGFDVPLKTNLEMVRIFKQLNGTVVTEVLTDRPRHPVTENVLPLWKAGMSALIPREAARFAVGNKLVNQTVEHLIHAPYNVHRVCPDELLWATIFGNKKLVPAPGSFEAADFYRKLVGEKPQIARRSQQPPASNFTPSAAEPFWPHRYMISRFQIWDDNPEVCHGQMTHRSCSYGLGDVHQLVQRSELVAHKFHLDVEPAAYFCMWKFIRERALDPLQEKFRGHSYRRIAHARVNAGESLTGMSVYFTEN
ncbi:hypothetical protein M3Y99_01678400 [Aphelenchoides fujianensis]|nr:hypothetical protein M3Y99_01678400 [Aphelenchoides fujianensis]